VTFDLPMPPSANNLFTAIQVKGRTRWIIKRGYKAWREEAGDCLMAQYTRYGAPAIHKPVELRIRLNLDHKGDIANREKAITDLLVEHLDMPDDRWIDRIVIERDRTVEAAVVSIGGVE
jgi:Holliday junction resolvase RusA-like endonuclease